MTVFKGSATAMITPFKNDAIDFDSFAKLIDFQLENNTDALVICGTTGEASTMTFEEKMSAIEFAINRVGGRIPVIAGTGGNNTKEVIKASKEAQKIGADALLVVTPYYNKTTQAGLVAHYNAVANEVDIPIIAYNVPGRTGVNILPETMKKISEHKNVRAIKEASGNIEQIVKLCALCPNVDVYSGNDDHVLPVMAMGGKGVISTVSNILPAQMHKLCSDFFAGNIEDARKMQFYLLDMCKAAFCEVNPIPIKTMLSLYNMCESELRLPLVAPQEKSLELMKNTMKEYNLL